MDALFTESKTESEFDLKLKVVSILSFLLLEGEI